MESRASIVAILSVTSCNNRPLVSRDPAGGDCSSDSASRLLELVLVLDVMAKAAAFSASGLIALGWLAERFPWPKRGWLWLLLRFLCNARYCLDLELGISPHGDFEVLLSTKKDLSVEVVDDLRKPRLILVILASEGKERSCSILISFWERLTVIFALWFVLFPSPLICGIVRWRAIPYTNQRSKNK